MREMAKIGGVMALAVLLLTLLPGEAHAWGGWGHPWHYGWGWHPGWHRWGWHAGWHHPFWVPGHWGGAYWVRGHWA